MLFRKKKQLTFCPRLRSNFGQGVGFSPAGEIVYTNRCPVSQANRFLSFPRFQHFPQVFNIIIRNLLYLSKAFQHCQQFLNIVFNCELFLVFT
nr:MAG TPA: hypothetical protein [Microviridae sp.]